MSYDFSVLEEKQVQYKLVIHVVALAQKSALFKLAQEWYNRHKEYAQIVVEKVHCCLSVIAICIDMINLECFIFSL